MMTNIFTAWQIIIIYFTSLIFSNLITSFATYPYENVILAGASGAIFSLLGAVCYYHFKEYNKNKNGRHKQLFFICIFVILLQLIFDAVSIFEYQVYSSGRPSSLLGHLSGFVGGFYISFLIFYLKGKKKKG